MAIKIEARENEETDNAFREYEEKSREEKAKGKKAKGLMYCDMGSEGYYRYYCRLLFDWNDNIYDWDGEYLSVKIDKKWEKEFETFMEFHNLFFAERNKVKTDTIVYHIKRRYDKFGFCRATSRMIVY